MLTGSSVVVAAAATETVAKIASVIIVGLQREPLHFRFINFYQILISKHIYQNQCKNQNSNKYEMKFCCVFAGFVVVIITITTIAIAIRLHTLDMIRFIGSYKLFACGV